MLAQTWRWLDYTAPGRLLLAGIWLTAAVIGTCRGAGIYTYVAFVIAGMNIAYSMNPPRED